METSADFSAGSSSTNAIPPITISTTRTIYTPPKELNNLLSLARSTETTNESVWRDLTETALEWMLSLKPHQSNELVDSKSKGKGKGKNDDDNLVHWYCSKGESCWETSVFMVRCVCLRKVGEVEEWRNKFDR